jgi:hypothetical protein
MLCFRGRKCLKMSNLSCISTNCVYYHQNWHECHVGITLTLKLKTMSTYHWQTSIFTKALTLTCKNENQFNTSMQTLLPSLTCCDSLPTLVIFFQLLVFLYVYLHRFLQRTQLSLGEHIYDVELYNENKWTTKSKYTWYLKHATTLSNCTWLTIKYSKKMSNICMYFVYWFPLISRTWNNRFICIH